MFPLTVIFYNCSLYSVGRPHNGQTSGFNSVSGVSSLRIACVSRWPQSEQRCSHVSILKALPSSTKTLCEQVTVPTSHDGHLSDCCLSLAIMFSPKTAPWVVPLTSHSKGASLVIHSRPTDANTESNWHSREARESKAGPRDLWWHKKPKQPTLVRRPSQSSDSLYRIPSKRVLEAEKATTVE